MVIKGNVFREQEGGDGERSRGMQVEEAEDGVDVANRTTVRATEDTMTYESGE